MLRHLLTLIWKRKTRNFMLSLEIMLAFAIVFAIAAAALRNVQVYRMPLGFKAEDLWTVSVGQEGTPDQASYAALERAVRELPEVLQVAFANITPYSLSNMTQSISSKDVRWLNSDCVWASDDLAQALGLELVEGRWFSALDNGSPARPVVINRRLAKRLFPARSAVLGQQFSDSGDLKNVYKVVGVVSEYRPKGELSAPIDLFFARAKPGPGGSDASTMIIKVKPGTGRDFQARLNRQLRLVRSDWSYQIAPLSAARASMLRLDSVPLLLLAVVAAFMLVMVAFGLFGALWQNTIERVSEFGLRRALGARAADIYRQIIAEQLLVSSVAIVAGLVLLVQLPLTGAFGERLNWTVFAEATALSMFVIYLISMLCSLYPGWRASRLSPTEALHYE
jgi:putative ABC transport system permease protein